MNRASSLQSDYECENVTDRDQNARKFFLNREKPFANGKTKILSSADITGKPHSERGASTSGATAFAQLMHMDAARDRPRQRSALPSRRWKLRIARSSP
jgi:hypothetical protein